MDQKTDMQIVKTTDYFNMTKEEAAEMRNEYDTREEAEVLDAGLEHYFFGTYEGLCKDYESTEFKNYVKKHKYEVLRAKRNCKKQNCIKISAAVSGQL